MEIESALKENRSKLPLEFNKCADSIGNSLRTAHRGTQAGAIRRSAGAQLHLICSNIFQATRQPNRPLRRGSQLIQGERTNIWQRPVLERLLVVAFGFNFHCSNESQSESWAKAEALSQRTQCRADGPKPQNQPSRDIQASSQVYFPTAGVFPRNQCALCQNILPARRVFPVTRASMEDRVRKPERSMDHVGRFRTQRICKPAA
jgi:hypothetical protein